MNNNMQSMVWRLNSTNHFRTKVQGWCDPTTFLRTEVTGSILNKSSRMIQSYHILEYWSHQIHYEPRFKDDTILLHSRGLKSPNAVKDKCPGIIQPHHILDDQSHRIQFRTNVQGWYNPTTFSKTEVTRSILNKSSGMIQSHHILKDRSHWICSE